VSEYQYYDFRAVDRPLTKNEMAAIPSISTRPAMITTSFTNPANGATRKPIRASCWRSISTRLATAANWGTQEFYIRLSWESIDSRCSRPWPGRYCPGAKSRDIRRATTFNDREFGVSRGDDEDDGTCSQI